jgi:4-amino-4-deoxy-L-arabinose transferase-like glycosyltransferase
MKEKILIILIFFLAFVLRFYQLGSNPPSLYWDEASLGYNGFSIATTLRDEHGEFLPLTRFIAFGDYKPPGYIYAAAAAIKLFGLSEFTVRLPSALAGTLLALVTYFLTKELLKSLKNGSSLEVGRWMLDVSLVAAFLVAISPWSLQMSRGAFEANLATLFSGAGILFFLLAIRKKSILNFALCAFCFAVSMYTFNSHRVFVPLMVGALVLIFSKYFWANKKNFLLFSFCLLLFIMPLAPYLMTRESRLRFEETSWLNDLAPIELSNQRIADDGNIFWSKIIHNRRVVYSLEFLKHYLDHFNPSYLFFTGDVNPRLSTQSVGELYLIELPFLLAGIFFLIKQKGKISLVLFCWALLAPIPAAFARETPHALRTLNILPAPQIIVAFGVWKVIGLLREFRFIGAFLKLTIVLYLAFCILYLRDYYFSYPKEYAMSWQYGYKQMVEFVAENKDKYDKIKVTGYYGRPYIYSLLYNQYLPEKYWQTRIIDRDWYGFWYVHGFDKYVFDDTIPVLGKVLYVDEPGKKRVGARLVKTIVNLKNEPVLEIWE